MKKNGNRTKNKESEPVNKLCSTCSNDCKQDEDVKLVSCLRYRYLPTQIYLPFWSYKRWTKGNAKT